MEPTQMSETKHTPGPWTLETVTTEVGICHKIGPFPGHHGRKTGHACIYHDGAINKPSLLAADELYANARLVAAAPDLLAACQHILAILDHPTKSVSIFDADVLKEAIEKATEQPQ